MVLTFALLAFSFRIMQEKIQERVSVVAVYDREAGAMPRVIRWNGRLYQVTKLGYHHKVKQGQALQHIFSVATETLAFRLRHDTESLIWWLEEVSDGVTT